MNDLLKTGAPVALGLSGGKDSHAMAFAVTKYLDEIGHPRSKRVAVHADLGVIEWEMSQEWCSRTAAALGLELITVRRAAGDLADRMEDRWRRIKARYGRMALLRMMSPWPSAAMRYCTSETKVAPINSALRKRFPGEAIISACGIRRQESPARSKQPVAKPNAKLFGGLDWHPIIEWFDDEVFAEVDSSPVPLHPAYRTFGSTRLSCSFCVLARISDHEAALRFAPNHATYVRLVELEADSAFSFQPSRWLGDLNPGLLGEDLHRRLEAAKALAPTRVALQAELPKVDLENAWPPRAVTAEEAEIIARVRCRIAELYGISAQMTCVNTTEVRAFFAKADQPLGAAA